MDVKGKGMFCTEWMMGAMKKIGEESESESERDLESRRYGRDEREEW